MSGELGKFSTADEVLAGIDLTGKRVLVTGVSSGIGAETARALVACRADVIGAARDLAKAEGATRAAREAAKTSGSFDIVELDLASLASARKTADALVARGEPLDLIIANAGVMAIPFGLSEDGFELQLATNHLGHFVLVNRIAGLLRPGGRLVMLSSSAHRGSDVSLDDPNFTATPYNTWAAYSRSKTANMLFAVEFGARHAARGITACGVHPGRVDTGLFRHLGEGGLDQLVATVDKGLAAQGLPPSFTKTPAQGAATSVWAAVVAPAEAVAGWFCEDCQVSERNDGDNRLGDRVGVRSYAVDPAHARALWTRTEEWVGERFPA